MLLWALALAYMAKERETLKSGVGMQSTAQQAIDKVTHYYLCNDVVAGCVHSCCCQVAAGELTATQQELMDALLLRVLRDEGNVALLGPLMGHFGHCHAVQQLQRGLCVALGVDGEDAQRLLSGHKGQGALPSGTHVTAQWLATHRTDVACARCARDGRMVVLNLRGRVTMSRSEASTWGLLVLDGEQVHAEGFGVLLLGGVYGRLSRGAPCKEAYVVELLHGLDQGWRAGCEL